ncbi:hypothetical protein VM1G_04667 [Cytospora mali]|uniref:Uncharacterized protein n=1 Tax=Cytospora mali TaxID=578113 RepID=A0A194VW93_CYTMA|nr:hypothetical protein VM1G_04667 [Valsa mali]
MENSWTPEQLNAIILRLIALWPGAAALLRSRGVQERLRQVTRPSDNPETAQNATGTSSDELATVADALPSAPTFESLPSEILMCFAEQLTPTNIQPYLDATSMRAYKGAQNDLRNLGLVSKRMHEAIRPYLYRGIIVDNSDVLVKLVRTLDTYGEGLAQYTKDLVLQVPYHATDEGFRELDTSPLLSCEENELIGMSGYKSEACQYWYPLGRLHLYVLKWMMNLETMSLAMPATHGMVDTSIYLPFWEWFYAAARSPFRFLPKLTTVHLLGDRKTLNGQLETDHCRGPLDIPSVRKLICYRDNGVWFDLTPASADRKLVTFSSRWQRNSSNFQFRNITTIELHQSACTPLHIVDICNAFPCLQNLSVSTDAQAAKAQTADHATISTGVCLSDGLAKLHDLETLDLDLHYTCDFSNLLGPHGVLNLQPLSGLRSLRMPLHYLVEKQPGGVYVVSCPTAVLPPSLKSLALSTDINCVDSWRASGYGMGPLKLPGMNKADDKPMYQARVAALEFLEAVCARVPEYFLHLEQVTFCYGVEDPLPREITYPHYEAIRLLSPQANMECFTVWYDIIHEAFKQRGVRFKVVAERITHM